MTKAKFILTVIAVFAIIGGTLAFKTARFNEFPLYTIVGFKTTSQTIAGCTYTALVPYCTTVSFFLDPDGLIFTKPRFETILSARATCIGGLPTVTAAIPYLGCPTFPATFITIVP